MRKKMMGKLRKMSKTYYLRQIVACLLVYCILLAVPAQVAMATSTPGVDARPSVGDFTSTAGNAAYDGVTNTTTITAPNGSVFDWENFDIGSNQNVIHLQGTTDAVLHRINVAGRSGGGLWGDGAATGINGDLSAPGYLFVVNPMGIIMGADAMISANRFVASGLNISNFSDFTSGATNELQFEGYDASTLGVELQAGGQISASAVALIGKTVVNDGTINSDSVVLVAGERIYLAVTDDSGKLAVDVTDLLTTVPADNTVDNTGTINAADGNVLLAAGDIYSLAISGVEDLAAEANRDIILDDNIQAGEILMEAGQDLILADDKTMDSDGILTLEADRDIILGGAVTAGGTMTLKADADTVDGGDVRAKGKLTTIGGFGNDILVYGDNIQVDGMVSSAANVEMTASDGLTLASDVEADGNIDLYSSDNTTYLGGDLVQAAGDITLHNNTELNGGAVQRIEATTGQLYANASVHKTSTGNLEMFGGSEISLGTSSPYDYSVSTKGVRVEDGELTIEGNRYVLLDGSMYSSGNMKLAANSDADSDTGYLFHSTGTIRSLNGDVDLSAYNSYIYLYGDNGPVTGNYIEAGGDILLNDYTYILGGKKLFSGGDIVFAAGETLEAFGSLTLEAGHDISLRGLVEANGAGDVSLTTISGDVSVNDVRALDDQITINSGGAIAEYGSDPAADLTASTLLLTANTGIIGQSPIETSATDITASTDAGDIDIDNTNGSATTASLAVTTGAGTILFSQAGDGSLDVTSATTADGSIGIDVDNAALTAQTVTAGGAGNVSLTTTTSGNVIVDDIRAVGNLITIDSAGAIEEYDNDAESDLTANELDLDAVTGIYGLSPIETEATLIAADTTDGDIDISNENTEDTTATSLTTGTGDIDFYQHGGGSLQVDMATTDDGYIDVEVADGGDLSAISVEAGGDFDVLLTTTAGDVFVDDVKALGNTITIDSAGAIEEYDDDPEADLTADELNLDALTGIFGQSPIETSATLIAADTTNRDIDIDNTHTSDVLVTSLTTGTGNILFSQDGGGNLTVTHAETTTDGSIAIDVTEADLTAVEVIAGGAGNVQLTTTTTGDIMLGTVTALDDEVDVDSAGSINDASDDSDVDVAADMLILSANDEIGGNPALGTTIDALGAIETTVNGLDAQSNLAGDIVIVETDDVDLYDVIATSGSIYLEATNGGMTHVIPAEGTYTIEAGSSTLTLVQQNDLDLAGFTFANQANTDLMVEITEGGFTTVDTANGGNDDNAADQWLSIQALTVNNIVLQGSDADEDIKIGTHPGFEPLNHPFGGVVESSEGGVSIISDNHTVRTAGDTILDNVNITGTSDDELDIGVDLPYGPGKAAIVIMGAEDLNLGENVELTASGTYDTTGDVDDREGLGLLDVRTEIPGGFPRYEGDPFDAAIYLASTEEDVDVSAAVSIMSSIIEDDLLVIVPEGAMVIDAYDTVTFDESGIGSVFEDSLTNGDVGDRLEVVSRITEWLFQAVGHLPYPSYPYNGEGPFPLGYTYVLRGAGLDNPAIIDGRAWVLVDPDNAPLDREAGEQAQRLILGLDGCPVLIAAVSAELGIPEETIEVSLANSYALNTDIQPCESCARLLDAAVILTDEDGSNMAAMNQVFNELAPAGAPFTPEVAASIVTAFAGRVNDGTQYATAIEYIDAFVRYIAVLDSRS
ncbi:MAG: hypothetical protein FVQ84_16240, partial [Planctomycetes bacterium]|nr:hypothetical protein [Planctomycetota bacterium]